MTKGVKVGRPFGAGKPGLFGFNAADQAQKTQAATGGKPLTNAVTRVATDQRYAISAFGASQTGNIRKAFLPARAAAQEGNVIVAAGREHLKAGAQTMAETLGMMKEGWQAQMAAGALAEARAVQQATGASDSQAAAFAQQLYVMELQHKWDVQAQKKAEGAALSAAGAAGGVATAQQAQGIIAQAPNLANQGAEQIRVATDLLAELPEKQRPKGGVSVSQVMGLVEGQYGYAAGTPEYLLIQANVREQLTNGGGAGEALEVTIPQLYGAMDPNGKWLQSTMAAAVSGVEVKTREQRKNYVKNNPEGWLAQQGIYGGAENGGTDVGAATASQITAAQKVFVDNPNASGGMWVKGNMETAKIPAGYHAIGDDGNLTQVLPN